MTCTPRHKEPATGPRPIGIHVDDRRSLLDEKRLRQTWIHLHAINVAENECGHWAIRDVRACHRHPHRQPARVTYKACHGPLQLFIFKPCKQPSPCLLAQTKSSIRTPRTRRRRTCRLRRRLTVRISMWRLRISGMSVLRHSRSIQGGDQDRQDCDVDDALGGRVAALARHDPLISYVPPLCPISETEVADTGVQLIRLPS